MAYLGEKFSQATLPEAGNFEPIPPGWYSANISEAALNQTKAGTGEFISLRLSIIGPSHQGRTVWANLNIRNPSQKAEEIGRGQLNSVLRAIGLATVEDTDELIGGGLDVKVTIGKNEAYGDRNEVKAFRATEGSALPSVAQTAIAVEEITKAPKVSASPPWARQ